MVYAIVRVRGSINVRPQIAQTLHLLRLTKTNHCVLVEENDIYRGMLQVVKDYATWGEVTAETVSQLIASRGMLSGDRTITDEYVKSATSFDSIKTLAKAIVDKKFTYSEIPEVKPLFRLTPPKKGYEGVKRSYANGGALGYRGKDMDTLIKRMI